MCDNVDSTKQEFRIYYITYYYPTPAKVVMPFTDVTDFRMVLLSDKYFGLHSYRTYFTLVPVRKCKTAKNGSNHNYKYRLH